jgi:predicted ABC-type ATPase
MGLSTRRETRCIATAETDIIYVTVQVSELNITRVANRLAMGGHDVPHERIRARRDRSHRMFAWFAKEADEVFVFDNSTTLPSVAAVKDSRGWALLDLDLLATDLAATIRSLAASENPAPQS